MKTYHNGDNSSTFTKYLGVEVNDGDTIMVEVIVSKDNGAIEVNLPEGRKLNTFEKWAVRDEIEADNEIQDAIQDGEEEARHELWISARGFSA